MSAPVWRKASRSNSQGQSCVEVAGLGRATVGLRDSKHVHRGHLTVSAPQFRALLGSIKATR
ncbi:uncharacterized protein DUF397 [Actinocorallia herbida]|uniref:Uncharacterized protein DUF397 n=1 Tax=Actinocorallia herbida TaxID=58109 RepID=A0A3N1D2M8_9ACTN|nr:DUF397 domain-containing protein [Actinocorallia herbida]ROO87789.1 uncharacterized protein DUF397 [Actinocorallia herbida]